MSTTSTRSFKIRPVRSDIGAKRIGFARSKRSASIGSMLIQWGPRCYVAAQVDRCEYDRIVDLDNRGLLRDSELRIILETAVYAAQTAPIVRRIRRTRV